MQSLDIAVSDQTFSCVLASWRSEKGRGSRQLRRRFSACFHLQRTAAVTFGCSRSSKGPYTACAPRLVCKSGRRQRRPCQSRGCWFVLAHAHALRSRVKGENEVTSFTLHCISIATAGSVSVTAEKCTCLTILSADMNMSDRLLSSLVPFWPSILTCMCTVWHLFALASEA